MDRLANDIIASKRKGQVTDPSTGFGIRQILFDIPYRFNEPDRVIIMFLHSGTDCQHIWIKNNIFRRESCFLCQQVVGTSADLDLSF